MKDVPNFSSHGFAKGKKKPMKKEPMWDNKRIKSRTRYVNESLDKKFGKDRTPKVGWTNQ